MCIFSGIPGIKIENDTTTSTSELTGLDGESGEHGKLIAAPKQQTQVLMNEENDAFFQLNQVLYIIIGFTMGDSWPGGGRNHFKMC